MVHKKLKPVRGRESRQQSTSNPGTRINTIADNSVAQNQNMHERKPVIVRICFLGLAGERAAGRKNGAEKQRLGVTGL